MAISWRAIVSLGCGLLLPVPGRSQPAEAPPGIYCIAIGVGSNGAESLVQAPAAARRFAGAVNRFLPSSQAHTVLLIDEIEAPTPARVRQLLEKEISKIPRYSTVFVYYAGHGEVVGTASPKRDLKFVLSGQKTSDVHQGEHIGLIDLMNALGQRKMITGMVVLDCCHSGLAADPAAAANERFRLLEKDRTSARFAYLLAAGSDQETIVGEFTDELIETWEKISAGDVCTTPEDLVVQVRKLAAERDRIMGTRNRKLLKSQPPIWCLGSAGQPAMMILLVPAAGYTGTLSLWYGDKYRGDVPFDQVAMFPVMLPKTTSELQLDCDGVQRVYAFEPGEQAFDVLVLRTDGKKIENLAYLPIEQYPVNPLALNQAEAFIESHVGFTQESFAAVCTLARAFSRTGGKIESREFMARYIAAAGPPELRQNLALVSPEKNFDDLKMEKLVVTGSYLPSAGERANPYRILDIADLSGAAFWDLQRASAEENVYAGVTFDGRPSVGMVELRGLRLPGDAARNLALFPVGAIDPVEQAGAGVPSPAGAAALGGVTNVRIGSPQSFLLVARTGTADNEQDFLGSFAKNSAAQQVRGFVAGSWANGRDSYQGGLEYQFAPAEYARLNLEVFNGHSENELEQYDLWVAQMRFNLQWGGSAGLDLRAQIGEASLDRDSLTLREPTRLVELVTNPINWSLPAGELGLALFGRAGTEEGWQAAGGRMYAAGIEIDIPLLGRGMGVLLCDDFSLTPLLMTEHRTQRGDTSTGAVRATWSAVDEQLEFSGLFSRVNHEGTSWNSQILDLAVRPRASKRFVVRLEWKNAAVPALNDSADSPFHDPWSVIEETGWSGGASWDIGGEFGRLRLSGTFGSYEDSRRDTLDFVAVHRQLANAGLEWRGENWFVEGRGSWFRVDDPAAECSRHVVGNIRVGRDFTVKSGKWSFCVGVNDLFDDRKDDLSQLVPGVSVGREGYVSLQLSY